MRLDLDVLAPREARALLTRLLGAQRVRAEEDAAVAELARLCGHLPLALRIAAANLSGHPGATVAGYAAELAGSDRLRALEAGEDPETAVRMAFDRSYATLPATARRLFRLLGLVPGPDIGPRAAAALAATDAATAAALLDRLARAHLAGEHAPDCYGMHDLLRRHAADRAAEEDGQADRDAALGRLLDHYLHGVDAAARRLLPQMVRLPLAPPGNGQPVAGFDDEAQASEWLDAERRNLVACILHAAEHGPAAAWRLADALRGHLFLRASTVDWSLVANAGLAAAERAGDPAGQAAAHLSIATLHWVQNHTLEVGDRFMEGEAVRLRAVARREAGRPAEALHLARTAVALARDAGDRRNEADALTTQASIHDRLGDHERATDCYGRALAIARGAGKRYQETSALVGLAAARHHAGDHDRAGEHAEQALTFARQGGYRLLEADALTALAAARLGAGDAARAADPARQALAIHGQTGHRPARPAPRRCSPSSVDRRPAPTYRQHAGSTRRRASVSAPAFLPARLSAWRPA